jgi:hypothetical protein
MANIKKSFNFRNGVQVDDDNFVINPNGLVGIGSTVPREFLDVRGNVIIDGTLTVNSINSAILITNNPTFTTATIGITSITSGIISATSGIVTYYGDGGNLINIPTSQWIDVDSGFGYTSIYSAGNVGIATTNPVFTFQVGRNPIVSDGIGISSNGNVYSSGIVTATGFVGDVTGNINSSGVSTFSGGIQGNVTGNLTGNVTGNVTGNINSSGVSTFSGGILGNVTGNINSSGVSTFSGGLEGNVTGNINSTGISTFSTLKVGTAVTISGGIVTATTFVGALTGTATSTTNIPNLTGAITSNNTTTSLGSFTSAQLEAALTDETGSGANVFATSPTLVTPTLGSATATSIIVGSGVTVDSGGITASAGIITASRFVGELTGNVVGIASTARDLTSDARVSIAHIASQTSSIGISTVSTRLYAESIGVGTDFPSGDIHIRKSSASRLQVTSDTAEAIIAIGRSTELDGSNGALIFGNTAGIYQYSDSKTLDIVNYDTGNINQYLDYGLAGVGTGNFNWIYGRDANNPLMSLTYGGNLGLGVTDPTVKLQVSGIASVTSLVTQDITATTNIVATGAGTSTSVQSLYVYGGKSQILNSDGTEIFPPEGESGNLNFTSGISTFFDINVTNNAIINGNIGIGFTLPPLESLHIGGDYFDDPENAVVISSGGIGIGTTSIRFGGGIDATNVDANLGIVGIGTTVPEDPNETILFVNGNSEFYGNLNVTGITTSQNGFTSGIGVTNPVQITVSGNTLTFNVVGVGFTSLTLY